MIEEEIASGIGAEESDHGIVEGESPIAASSGEKGARRIRHCNTPRG